MSSLIRYGIFLCLLSFAAPSYALFDWLSHKDESVLWHFREQYVRLEPQAAPTANPNQHPVTLDPEQVATALASLTVSHNDASIPLFSRGELKIISEPIQRGLIQAQPNQDITFAVIGAHPGFVTNENRVTTGRVFYHNDRLNLIVGDVHAEIDYNEDRRLYPFVAGQRDQVKQPERPLLAQTGQHLIAQRADWVALDLAAAAAYQVRKQQADPAALADSAAQMQMDNARLDEEVSQLKAEVEALKQQPTSSGPARSDTGQLERTVSEIQAEIADLKQQQAQTPPPASGSNIATDELAARLRTLKQLREQGLITEEVYQQKQQEILQAL